LPLRPVVWMTLLSMIAAAPRVTVIPVSPPVIEAKFLIVIPLPRTRMVASLGLGPLIVAVPGTATINGPNPSDATILVRGNGITIRNFASITGGETGITVTRGAAAIIDNNVIQTTGRNGN